MARVVLLDLDRTLIDNQSFTDYCAARDEARALLDDVPGVEVPETGWHACASDAMALLFATAGTEHFDRVSDAIERHEVAAVPQSRAMPGLHAFLDRLDKPCAIVTLCPSGATAAMLDKHGVDIEHRVCRRADLKPKPAPDQLLEALRLLDAHPDDAVFVGDSTWDHAAAVAAGVGFIGVSNGRAPHEFGMDVRVGADLMEVADLIDAEDALGP